MDKRKSESDLRSCFAVRGKPAVADLMDITHRADALVLGGNPVCHVHCRKRQPFRYHVKCNYKKATNSSSVFNSSKGKKLDNLSGNDRSQFSRVAKYVFYVF